MKDNKDYSDVWFFIISVLILSFFINWLHFSGHLTIPLSFAQFGVGVLAFILQIFVNQKPVIELYSRSHPYSKLKPYGVFTAFLFFEFIIMWGLYTNEISAYNENIFLITVVFIGAIAYYHAFVRMKISLRFVFLAIFIPTIAAGAALGLGRYFKILEFIVPQQKIGNIIFFNTIYWILFNTFAQMVCEAPAFRGYLMQRLLDKGEAFAVLVSSLIFAIWYIPFALFLRMSHHYILIVFFGSFIMGAIFAILFIKGRNLLVAVACHGIISGLSNSLFATSEHPGIREYIKFFTPADEIKLVALWFACLFIGLILVMIVPRKKFYAR